MSFRVRDRVQKTVVTSCLVFGTGYRQRSLCVYSGPGTGGVRFVFETGYRRRSLRGYRRRSFRVRDQVQAAVDSCSGPGTVGPHSGITLDSRITDSLTPD